MDLSEVFLLKFAFPLSLSFLSINFISRLLIIFSRELKTVHWKYRNIACLIKSHTYATRTTHIHTWRSLPTITDIADDARTSLLRTKSRCECEIVEDCSVNTRSSQNPKSRFARGCDDAAAAAIVATRVEYEVIIRHSVKRGKRILRGDGNALLALRNPWSSNDLLCLFLDAEQI